MIKTLPFCKLCLLLIFLIIKLADSRAQQVVALYPEGQIPFNKADANVVPKLTIYPATSPLADGTAVIVFSGGAYVGRANGVEGIPACKKLAAQGITAFLVDYRVPDSVQTAFKEWGPLTDAQRAIQYVREYAGQYHINPNRIGMMGFSAGGHLVSTAGTHFNITKLKNPGHTSLRPDFIILIYPVISFTDSLTHEESRKRLIGPELDAEKIAFFSNELQVTDDTSPAYITHGIDDSGVKVSNTLHFAAALKQHNVPVELFLYTKGEHGYGIFNKNAKLQWIDDCIHWINADRWKTVVSK